MYKQSKYQAGSSALQVLRAGLFLLFAVLIMSMANGSGGNDENGDPTSNGGGGNVEQFAIKTYSFQGEFLYIEYYVPFPGMTKVKLFQGTELLWRGQYVDELKGDHRIVLRASKLTPGEGYNFEFNYKGVERSLPVVAQ